MKFILTIIMMSGSVHSFEYLVGSYNPYLCDAAFKSLTYTKEITNYKGRKQMATFYKNNEVLGHSCNYKKIND